MDSESRDRIRAVIARLADIPDDAFAVGGLIPGSPSKPDWTEPQHGYVIPARVAKVYGAEFLALINEADEPNDDGADCGA